MARMTKAQLDEWWGDCDFKTMEYITGYRQYEFSPEDGYQDFIDACDEYWDKLKYADKVYLYKQFAL